MVIPLISSIISPALKPKREPFGPGSTITIPFASNPNPISCCTKGFIILTIKSLSGDVFGKRFNLLIGSFGADDN